MADKMDITLPDLLCVSHLLIQIVHTIWKPYVS